MASSPEQAKLKNMESRIADRVMEGMSQQLEDMSVQISELREAMGTVPPSGVTVGTQLRLAPIEDRLERLSADVRDLRARGNQAMPAWLWFSGWLLAATIAVAWWKSRSLSAAEPPEDPASRGERAPFRTSSEASTRTPGASRAERVGSAAT